MSEVFANGMNVNISIQPENANDNAPIQITVLPPAEGPKGEPGFSPKASVKKTETGAVITVEDEEGVTSAVIENGKDGKDGAPGKDGYTPQKGVDYFDGVPGKDGYTPQKGVDYFDGTPGRDGAPGKDGYTPRKGIDYFDGAPGKDGKDGAAGAPGADGFSPIAKVVKTSNGATVEITDKNGTTSAEIKNGTDGESGYTPQKGKDYFDGAPGEPGKSAYEIARENGFDGTEEEWLDYLRADSDKMFLVTITGNKADRTAAEIRAAVQNEKIVMLRDSNGRVYIYYGEMAYGADEIVAPTFITVCEYLFGKGIAYEYLHIKEDGYVATSGFYPANTPNPNKLTIISKNEKIEYDGSLPKTIDLSDLGSGGSGVTVSSPTDEEVLTALAENDLIMAVMDTDGGILADENGTIIEW